MQPRQGQDIVDVPEGVPFRTWTRNKGQTDKEALAGACRNWTRSDGETFKAHLIGFRGFGIDAPDPRFNGYKLTPAAVGLFVILTRGRWHTKEIGKLEE